MAAAPAHADTYPSKPIRMVVTFPGGGAPDILARLFAEKSALGQPVVVDNKPGAGGNIGAEAAARSPADGYTLVLGTVGTHSINGSLYSKMPYDMVKDFTPSSWWRPRPTCWWSILGAGQGRGRADRAGQDPAGRADLRHARVGTSPHVAGEMFNTLAGVKLTHVPYKAARWPCPTCSAATSA